MKIYISTLLVLVFNLAFAQYVVELDHAVWEFEVSEPYKVEFVKSDSIESHLTQERVSIYKDEDAVNKLVFIYGENHNMRDLTPEIYVFTVQDLYKRIFNTEDFEADVQMERREMLNDVFYLIRSTVNHLESDYKYISDLYISEIDGKEFSVFITYDNDDDKAELEKIFYNSEFR